MWIDINFLSSYPILSSDDLMKPLVFFLGMVEHAVLAQTLPKDQQYMGAFLGQMGPDKVLKPWFQAFIKEKVASKELKLKGDMQKFFTYLSEIQAYLNNIVLSHQIQPLMKSPMTKEIRESVLQQYHDGIHKTEEEMVKFFCRWS
jgi:hypothetical protein